MGPRAMNLYLEGWWKPSLYRGDRYLLMVDGGGDLYIDLGDGTWSPFNEATQPVVRDRGSFTVWTGRPSEVEWHRAR
jgi:hypothetical protein